MCTSTLRLTVAMFLAQISERLCSHLELLIKTSLPSFWARWLSCFHCGVTAKWLRHGDTCLFSQNLLFKVLVYVTFLMAGPELGLLNEVLSTVLLQMLLRWLLILLRIRIYSLLLFCQIQQRNIWLTVNRKHKESEKLI